MCVQLFMNSFQKKLFTASRQMFDAVICEWALEQQYFSLFFSVHLLMNGLGSQKQIFTFQETSAQLRERL